MGAWGFRALESDEGLDVVDFIEGNFLDCDHLKLGEVLQSMRAEDFLPQEEEEIDFFYDNSAMAVTELYFEFKDTGKLDYGDDEGESVYNNLRAFTAEKKDLEILLLHLQDIHDAKPDADGEREICVLFRDNPEWKKHLEKLIWRLDLCIQELER